MKLPTKRVRKLTRTGKVSYTVNVPKDFTVNKEMLSDLSDWALEGLGEALDETDKESLDLINSELDKLKNGNELYAGWGGTQIFELIAELLEKNNLVVMVVDGAGGDGEDTIVPFKDKRKKKK